jgi:predicted LPLAT superfamily acyltransferase
MAKWTGKSKGSLLGYKIFTFLIRKTHIRISYFVLYFVASYYFLFSWKSSKSIYYYFRNIQNFNWLKSVISIYKSYYVFGQTLIDRIIISTGMIQRFTFEKDGFESIMNAFDGGNGGVLISAHIGNFEISEYFFEVGHKDMIINILTTDLERENIKNYLENLSIKSKAKFISLGNDMSHIFELNKALSNNEFICFTGDRFIEGMKYLEADFMGKKAKFPAGPFIIASKLKVPVIFVYVMKDSSTHYHLYGRMAEVSSRDVMVLFNSYIENLTYMVKKYPYQWFNYYEFWK